MILAPSFAMAFAGKPLGSCQKQKSLSGFLGVIYLPAKMAHSSCRLVSSRPVLKRRHPGPDELGWGEVAERMGLEPVKRGLFRHETTSASWVMVIPLSDQVIELLARLRKITGQNGTKLSGLGFLFAVGGGPVLNLSKDMAVAC